MAFSQLSLLHRCAHSGSGTEVVLLPLVLSAIHVCRESRGIRTEPPMRSDGISPRAARPRTLVRLIERSRPASTASSRRGQLLVAEDACATGATFETSVKLSMSWLSIATMSPLACAETLGA